MKKLVLVDAYSQIFRGFYAVRNLTNAAGFPTNAIFVFARMLLKLHREYASEYGALVFDCGRVGFRMELNPEYKMNRAETPEELKLQIPVIREFAAAFGWPLLEEKEYEADDLIAALAINKSGEIDIVSSDKDLAQLVGDTVKMIVPGKAGGFEIRDRTGVRERFGVEPEQMVDYLSLIGDASDNVGGIAGIGPKTAAKLLGEFGSIDGIYLNLEKVESETLRNKLAEGRALLERNCKLIRLRSDLPERFNSDELLRRGVPDWRRISEMAINFDLHVLTREIAAAEKGVAPSPPEKEKKPQSDMVQGELF